MHAVHIGRRSAQVAEIALESVHLHHLLHLAQNALLGATGNEFSLMGRNGAEGTASETAPMDIDTELNHVVGGNALVLIFQMGYAGIGQVEGGVEFLGGHRWIGWVDNDGLGDG